MFYLQVFLTGLLVVIGVFALYRAIKMHLEIADLPYGSERRQTRQSGVKVMGSVGVVALVAAVVLIIVGV